MDSLKIPTFPETDCAQASVNWRGAIAHAYIPQLRQARIFCCSIGTEFQYLSLVSAVFQIAWRGSACDPASVDLHGTHYERAREKRRETRGPSHTALGGKG